MGELAKKMDVTVRTLQYYDREGVLFTVGRERGEDAGLYTDKDLVRLHPDFISWKSLGFSLDDH